VTASAALIGLLAAPSASRASSSRRHAICAVLGQPWHCDQRDLDASVQAR